MDELRLTTGMSQYVLSSTNIPDLEEVVRMTVASQAAANMNYLQTSFSTASRTAVMQLLHHFNVLLVDGEIIEV